MILGNPYSNLLTCLLEMTTKELIKSDVVEVYTGARCAIGACVRDEDISCKKEGDNTYYTPNYELHPLISSWYDIAMPRINKNVPEPFKLIPNDIYNTNDSFEGTSKERWQFMVDWATENRDAYRKIMLEAEETLFLLKKTKFQDDINSTKKNGGC